MSTPKTLLKAAERFRAPAAELIAFQKDDFFKELTALIEKAYPTIENANEKERTAVAGDMAALITKRFKINAYARILGGEMSVYCPFLHGRPVFDSKVAKDLNADIESSQKSQMDGVLKFLGSKAKIKGAINLKDATVSGVYSEIPYYFDINLINFKQRGILPDETAACILHEVGHAYFSLEFTFRTIAASQILAAAHQVKTNREADLTYEDTIDMYRERIEKEGLITDSKEFVEVMKIDNETIKRQIVLSMVWGKCATDFGIGTSKLANFENLADLFAVRLGAAEPLMRALNKIGIQDTPTGEPLMYYITTAVMRSGGKGLFTSLLNAFFKGGPSNDGVRYDALAIYATPIERARRVQREVISGLKDPNLTSQERSILLTELDLITKSIDDFKTEATLTSRIADFLSKPRKDHNAALKLETELESLVNNKLFAASARLRNS